MIRWVLVGLAGVAALAWLVRAVYRLGRWHRANRPSAGFYLLTLALPLLVVTVPLVLVAARALANQSVPLEIPQTTVGRIEEMIVRTKHTSRYGPGQPYLAVIYLEDGEAYHLPGRSADPNEFLSRAGREPVTLIWQPIPTGGRQIYELTTAGGAVLFSYEETAAYLDNLLTLLLVLLGVVWAGAAGGVCTIPQRFYRPSNWAPPRTGRGVVIGSLCLYVLLAGLLLLSLGEGGTVTPAYTQVPLSLELALQLPGQWEEESDGEYIWYSNREDVSLCVHYYDLGAPGELGMEEEDWLLDYFASIRQFLLETFVDDSAMASFLSQRTTTVLPCGLEAVWAQGQAHSQGGSLNYFVTAALPEQGCAVMLQASSWDMSWEALANYGESDILPLLRCLVTDGSAG